MLKLRERLKCKSFKLVDGVEWAEGESVCGERVCGVVDHDARHSPESYVPRWFLENVYPESVITDASDILARSTSTARNGGI
jgi:hypothetical protein